MRAVIKSISLSFGVLPLIAGGVNPNNTFNINGNEFITCITGDQNYDYELSVVTPGGLLIVNTRIYNARTLSLVSSDSQNINTKSGEAKSVYITLPLYGRVKSDGVKIELNFVYNKQQITTTGIIYPYVKPNFNAKFYHQSRLELSNIFFKVTNTEIVTGEWFNFIDTLEFLSVGDRSNLDFSEISFRYPSSLAFRYDYAEFHIKDYNNIYPNLIKVNQEVVVRMKCSQKGSLITFSPNDNLYVNKDTLEMASFPKANYVATNEIYVPLGRLEDFAEDECYILLRNAGYSYSDITIPFTFFYDKNFIGECYMSDYCIVGGVLE